MEELCICKNICVFAPIVFVSSSIVFVFSSIEFVSGGRQSSGRTVYLQKYLCICSNCICILVILYLYFHQLNLYLFGRRQSSERTVYLQKYLCICSKCICIFINLYLYSYQLNLYLKGAIGHWHCANLMEELCICKKYLFICSTCICIFIILTPRIHDSYYYSSSCKPKKGLTHYPMANALSNHCTVAWVTRPERPMGVKDEVKQARRAQSRLEVGVRRALRLLVPIYFGSLPGWRPLAAAGGREEGWQGCPPSPDPAHQTCCSRPAKHCLGP